MLSTTFLNMPIWAYVLTLILALYIVTYFNPSFLRHAFICNRLFKKTGFALKFTYKRFKSEYEKCNAWLIQDDCFFGFSIDEAKPTETELEAQLSKAYLTVVDNVILIRGNAVSLSPKDFNKTRKLITGLYNKQTIE